MTKDDKNLEKEKELQALLEGSDLSIDKNGVIKTKNGRFVKGVSGNPKGRPKGTGKRQLEAKLKSEIEADDTIDPSEFGEDAVKALQCLLKTSRSRTEVKQLANILAPYQKPKKASIETKNTDFRRVEVHMVLPEAMRELENVYKSDEKLIEHVSDEDLKKLESNTFTAEEFRKKAEQSYLEQYGEYEGEDKNE